MVERVGFPVEVSGEGEDKDAIDKMCLRMGYAPC